MRRLGTVVALAAVALFVFAGCGDDDGGGSSTDTDAPSDTADSSTDDTSTGDADLDALLEKQQSSSIKITYNQDGSGEITVAHDGSSDPPQTSFTQGSTLTISGGDTGTMVTCDGIDTDSPTCTETPLPGDFLTTLATGLFGGFGAFLFAAGDEADNIPFIDVDTSSDEIAGRSATCVTWNLGELGEAFAQGLDAGDAIGVTGCFDDDTGWPLKYSTETEDGSTEVALQATEVSEPSASDFEPPVTPETIPSLDDLTVPTSGD